MRPQLFASRLTCIALSAGSIFLVYRLTLGANRLLWKDYAYPELLINYSGGFVRRGLLGSVIHLGAHGGPALSLTNAIVFWTFVFLTVLLTGLVFLRGLRAWTDCLALLVPAGLVHMAAVQEMFYRKEMFFYAALAVTGFGLALVSRVPGRRLRRLLAWCVATWAVASSLLCILVHEAFVFLAAPAQLCLLLGAFEQTIVPKGEELPTMKRRESPQRRIRRGYVALMVIAFLVVGVLRHGNVGTSDAIWNSLHPQDRQTILHSTNDRGSIGALTLTAGQVAILPLVELQSGMVWWYAAPLVQLFLYCFALIALNRTDHAPLERFLLPWLHRYGFIALCSGPAFLMGWDWGRWIAAISLTFLIVWLSLEDGSPAEGTALVPYSLKNWHLLSHGERQCRAMMERYARMVEGHRTVALFVMVCFALTFGLPELFVANRDGSTMQAAFHGIRSLMRHHPPR